MASIRDRFRTFLEKGCTPAAPVFDPLSARIAEMLGWKILKLSGSVGKSANLAVPDEVPLSNVSDLIDVCWRIGRVSDACLIVDADDGGGSALNVVRTVRELEATGACGIEIEDNAVPRRFGEAKSRHSLMLSQEEQVGKLKAAVAARRDPATVIIARTSALAELSVPEAIDRVRAYSQTGAEAIMFPRLYRDPSVLEEISAATTLPLLVLGLPQEVIQDTDFLNRNRVRVRFHEQLPYRMAVKAIADALQHLAADGGPGDMADRTADADLLRRVNRTEEFLGLQERFDSRTGN